MRNLGESGGAVRLPILMDDLRSLLRALDWEQIHNDIKQEASARLAIVGPVNSGKSTLFNLLEGKDFSPAGPIPGTTREAIIRPLGPFVLVDTPGFGEIGGVDRANLAARSAAEADCIVLLLDAGAGLRQGDADLLHYLQSLRRPVVVALNKIDLLGNRADETVADAAARLGVPVIPLSAKKGTNVAEKLVPALVDALPALAVALGRELPPLRRSASQRVVRQAAVLNTAIGAEPIPLIDIPVLLTTQARMVLRIAAIYGEPLTARHAKELIGTIAGGLAFRYLAQQGAKLVPSGGWAVAAGIAALGTFGIGQVAIEYFESGKRLTRTQMRDMYKHILKKDKGTFEREVAPTKE
ncbi:MAG: 50S ribosome-binding GTPase [Chloroflexota bacterium]|nr:50S ribosome-binding GTPase [Chloroflexota bacterium]